MVVVVVAISWLTQPVALSQTEADQEELRGCSPWSAGTGDQELTPAERASLAHLTYITAVNYRNYLVFVDTGVLSVCIF